MKSAVFLLAILAAVAARRERVCPPVDIPTKFTVYPIGGAKMHAGLMVDGSQKPELGSLAKYGLLYISLVSCLSLVAATTSTTSLMTDMLSLP